MPPKQQYNRAAAGANNANNKKDDSGWNKSSAIQTHQESAARKSLDFAHAAGKVATSVDEAAENLRCFIIRTVHDNNVLGLPDDEITSMARLLMQTPNKTEIFEWAQTLMQPKSFAEEIIRQRDIAASRFAAAQERQQDEEDGDDGAASVATTSAASSATARRKGGKGARGKVVSLGGARGGEQGDVLVEGAQFECGCFATAHAFRSNCANCGRIFCMQESDEVCYSCQLPPESCLALDLKQALGKISDAADRKDRQGLSVALERRDQLLQYARERAKRTSVIDDQSGSGHASKLADPWSSRAERAKAEVENEHERLKVAEMHRRTGAVAVHLDIVNSCVQLGATPLTKEKQDEQEPAHQKITMGLGFGGEDRDHDEKQKQREQAEQARVCAGISSKPLNLQKAKNNQGNTDDDEAENNENDDDEGDWRNTAMGGPDDDTGARRVIALPSLLSKIFYCKDDQEAEEKTKIKATLKQSQNAANLVVGAGKGSKTAPHRQNDSANKSDGEQQNARKVDFRRADDTKEAVRGQHHGSGSRRVQVEYFDEDNDTWLMAEQQDELFDNVNGNNNDNNCNNNSEPFASASPKSRGLQSSSTSSSAIRPHQHHASARNDSLIENERLLHMTLDDAAAGWKDVNTSTTSAATKKSNSHNDDDDDDAQNNASPSRARGIDSSLLLAQQRAKKLFHKDEGWCLSMHQPWASLLVAGIKTHEGRTWPTEWRGRLWIHAAAAKPQQSTIDEVEAHARQFVPPGTTFPSAYPTKCLLGCVALVDCLDREQYESAFPRERQQLGDASSHCFLCLGPKPLPFPLSMDGDHKIYKLDKKHWQAARKLLKEPVL